ncbi:MAG: hypothetical protein ABR923_10625 [Terracidiphilus sp.]|jgi:hypothetical protein
MAQQFENKEETKVQDETASGESAKKKIDHVAQKAAEKGNKTVKDFDKENSNLFTK